ncbi:MAG: carboxypeptidase-like regulatory domain-containing protein [Planctomycetota bacterium]
MEREKAIEEEIEVHRLAAAAALAVAIGVRAWRADTAPAGSARAAPAVAASEAPPPDRAADRSLAPVSSPAFPAAGARVVAGADPPVDPPGPAGSLTIRATFTDPEGLPLPGVRLREEESPEGAVSEIDGSALLLLPVALAGEEPAVRHLVAERAGFASLYRAIAPLPGEDVRLGVLALPRAGRVAGRVVDPAGKAVAGAEVGIEEQEIAPGEWDVFRRRPSRHPYRGPEAVTDAAGLFTLERVPAGRLRVWARTADRPFSYSAPVAWDAGADPLEVLVVLASWDPEDWLVGRVVAPDESPVPHAEIAGRYSAPGRSGTLSWTADEEGRIRVLAPAPGTCVLSAADPQGKLGPSPAQEVPSGEEAVVRLTPARRIELRVTAAGGAPIPEYGFRTTTVESVPTSFASPIAEHAGGIGELLLPGQRFDLTVHAAGFLSAVRTGLDPARLPPRLEIELGPAPVLAGRVLHSRVPVAGAAVSVHRAPPDGTYFVAAGFPCLLDPRATATAHTDREGRFRIELERADPVYLRGTAPGFAPSTVGPLFPGVPRAESTGDITLYTGGTIQGLVHAQAGFDPAGRFVLASHGDGLVRSTTVGRDGGYRLEALTPGSWRVALSTRDLPELARHVSLGSFDDPFPRDCEVQDGAVTVLDIGRPTPYSLAGSIDLGGTDCTSWSLTLVPIGDDVVGAGVPERTATGGAEGAFACTVPLPGLYRLVLRDPRDESSFRMERVVEVSARTAPLPIEIPTGRLRG